MTSTFHTLKNKLIKFSIPLFLITGGLFLGLFINEILIRVYNPQPFSVKIALPNFDTKTGMPNKEYKSGQKRNSFGFHDTEHETGEHPGTFRIVILGDSLLQKSTGKKIEIINLGRNRMRSFYFRKIGHTV